MSAAAIETTMPSKPAAGTGPVTARPPSARPVARAVCTAAPVQTATVRSTPDGLSPADLAERLIAANQRTAELEEQLAAVVAARDAAEHQAAQLEDLNRELACDLDNALDELAGHAGHAEQERLVRAPVWSPWSASADREGHDR
ncbi:hypothetical protein KO481_33480 [Nocardia sp. NEAU-G5]|uniref:Uncharacterized protein n=1 Tax=Nocardia albiluteola TaxID=2842303 RepID=A0ABS6B9K6_9NOCA|nr:hypothetical protein [Nocardia albiluteola]MBU3066421.1 hypothetical protein [Nocardia albiluteola]